jgi:excisionase family DNA binding protein
VQNLQVPPERSSGGLKWGDMKITRHSPLGLSTSQAAEALGVSLGTIRRWSDMGHLASYRTPGGQRRFSAEQIEEFLDKLERGAVDSTHQRVAS